MTYHEMALDAGCRGEEAEQVAAALEEEDRAAAEYEAEAQYEAEAEREWIAQEEAAAQEEQEDEL